MFVDKPDHSAQLESEPSALAQLATRWEVLMSLKQEAKKELESLQAWAQEANMQAHLAKAEVSAEFRSTWMALEQDAAKLEAKLDSLTEGTEQTAKEMLRAFSASYRKLRKTFKS